MSSLRSSCCVLFLSFLFLTHCSKSSDKQGEKTPTVSGEITINAKPAKDAPFIQVPLGLSDDLNIPADNPLTPEKVELGRMLYFDTRLSADNTISCATCHDPQKGWTDQDRTSVGFHKQRGARNSPTVINSTYMKLQFWDGRAKTLEEQALGPIANPIEMGTTHEAMVQTVTKIPGYEPLFKKAFNAPATKERVAQAIASFERTVLSGNSKYDRFVNGEKTAMNESEIRGKDLFFGKAKCMVCHNGPNFSDSNFHNLGVGMGKANPDLGRYVVTQAEKDMGAFKTPTLRDLDKTQPYMHDGSVDSLEEVMEFYNKGGEPNAHLSPLITKLNLTDQEKSDLVAFMKALAGNPYPDASPPELVK